MNSNIDFLSVWLETILFSSTEITDFSSQLSFFLANIKSKIWQLYVIWRHHCQSTRGSYLPLLIFSYKGISILYYSMITYVYLQIWIVSFNNIIFDFGLQLSCRKGVFNQINLQMIYVWKYGTMSKTNIFWIHPKPEKNRAVCIWDLLLPLKKDYEGWRGDILYNIVAVSQKEK